MESNRWGTATNIKINLAIAQNTPKNTRKSKEYAWKQFMDFCRNRNYVVEKETTPVEIANILKDYAFNMKKQDGSEYKETVIKFNWNVVAKLLQDKFYNDYNVKMNPFADIEFRSARDARDAKRKLLQGDVEKRKTSSTAFTIEENMRLLRYWKENNPEGLIKKFFFIAAKELAWRGNEGCYSKVSFFIVEKDNFGRPTGRIEYNPVFNKTNQGGSKSCTPSKWLIKNTADPDICPVRIFHKVMEKRPGHITSDRFFLTPNPRWKDPDSIGWYKNCPIGINSMSKWTKETCQKMGLDIQNKKFSNHSHRSTAVTHLAQAEVSEQEMMKITGHSSSSSLQSYMNMQPKRHSEILTKMRASSSSTFSDANKNVYSCSSSNETKNEQTNSKIVFQNCTFNVQNFNCNEL